MTAEDVVKRIAAECTFIDDRGGVGIRLKPAAAIVRQYGEQFRAVPRRKRQPPKPPPLQYRRHSGTLRAPHGFSRVIPEIDIWRAANLMLKRYGAKAEAECVTRTDELAAAGDHDGVAVWCRISDAVAQLSNTTPTGPVH